jgi:hypothetical protein
MTTIFEVFSNAKEVPWKGIAIVDNYLQKQEHTLEAVTTTAYTNKALEIHYVEGKTKERTLIDLPYVAEYVAAHIVEQGLSAPFLAAELQEHNSITAIEKGRKALADIKAAVRAIGSYHVALHVMWEQLRVCTSHYVSDYSNSSPIMVITLPVEVDYLTVIASSVEVKDFFESVIAAEKAAKEARELERKQQEEAAEAAKQEVMRNTIGATLVGFESGMVKMRRTDGSTFYIDAYLGDYDQCYLLVDDVEL